MNSQPDKLVERLAAMHADFSEFDEAFPAIGQSSRQLLESMSRHVRTGTKLIQRAENGKDCDAQIAELREIFSTYEPLLRSLSNNCLLCAEISRRIHDKLVKLNTPENG